MKILVHHIYEYKKGLRSLILHTARDVDREAVERRLRRSGIDYVIRPLATGRFNVFFGASECIAVIRAIGERSLADYTPEEDFILGTMLGYDRRLQCRRYLKRRDSQPSTLVPRLRLGTDCPSGSACSRAPVARRSLDTVRSQAEPGNESANLVPRLRPGTHCEGKEHV